MNPLGAPTGTAAARALLAVLLAASPLAAQQEIRVTLPAVGDARTRFKAETPWQQLSLHFQVEGAGLEEAKGFRITVTEAKDDTGSALTRASDKEPEWSDRPSGIDLWTNLTGVARAASTITVKGNLEVWIPSRDPLSEVKVGKIFAKAGKPNASKDLRDAKVTITFLPQERVNDGSVIYLGPSPDVARIHSARVVRADGGAIESNGRGEQSDGETTMVELGHGELIPPDAGIVFTLMTEKAVLVVPFELKDVPLP